MALSNNEILNLTDLYINEYKLEKEKHFHQIIYIQVKKKKNRKRTDEQCIQ